MAEPPDVGSRLPGLRHRSGAVARMAGLPVATLRIWERRYQVVAPPLTEAGHRLYSDHDVQRLVRIRRLVGLGHAIGTIASLDLEALVQLCERREGQPGAPTQAGPALPGRPTAGRTAWLVGATLGRRFTTLIDSNPGMGALWRPVAHFDDLAAAVEAMSPTGPTPTPADPVDVLLVQLPTVHADTVEQLLALMRSLRPVRWMVLYGFAPASTIQTLRRSGADARHDPLPDAALMNWLDQVPRRELAAPTPWPIERLPPRRFSDADLADISLRSTTVACECPRHVAQLITQLGRFETYSAECLSRHVQDAVLHAELQSVAATARSLFESALVRVAQAEGFSLPD
jgi:hypothetical protein